MSQCIIENDWVGLQWMPKIHFHNEAQKRKTITNIHLLYPNHSRDILGGAGNSIGFLKVFAHGQLEEELYST